MNSLSKAFLIIILSIVSLILFVGCDNSNNDDYSYSYIPDFSSKEEESSTLVEKESSSEDDRITISFDSNGGSKIANQKIEAGSIAYKPPIDPKKDGFSFLGWYLNDKKWDFSTTIQENITLVAKWGIPHSISFELDGGKFDAMEKDYYIEGEEFTLPTPTKKGFLFFGWSEGDGEEIYSTITIKSTDKGNKSYKAHWSLLQYTFNEDGTAIASKYSFSTSSASVTIPNTIRCNGIDYTVTEIGEGLFSGIATMLKNNEIIVNGHIMNSFTVFAPRSLIKINKNAFFDCNNVSIMVKSQNIEDLISWADALVVEEGNNHVVDVIKGRRPAIGWSIYG